MMLPPFRVGHATHPDPHMALALAAAQLEAQAGSTALPTLGLIYITDHYAVQAEAILAELRQRWPMVDWAGCVGVGVSVSGVEYFDEPALVLMLTELPREAYLLFNGERPLPAGVAQAALVHGDGGEADVQELIEELAKRTATGYLFGGLCASRGPTVQFSAPAGADGTGVYSGGLSGVGFGATVALRSRLTQGCQPLGPVRLVTAVQNNLVLSLDGEPALPCLLGDLGVSLEQPREALGKLRATLVGLTDPQDDVLARAGQFGRDTRVRHLIGVDPTRAGVAVADRVEPGMQLAFCRRDAQAARLDLVRICAELRDELCPPEFDDVASEGAPIRPESRVAGAVYVSCSGRGGPHFGAPSAELQILRHALGDVPLVGFFAGGEIARRHLYGYTGVLTLFLRD